MGLISYMEITRDIRNNLLNHIEPAGVYLYCSPTSGGIQLAIAQKYQLQTIEKYKKFALTIGDIILGFYKIEDTVPLLQQELELDAKTAALLGADVLDFLAPLSDPNWQPPAEVEDTQVEMPNDTTYQDESGEKLANPSIDTLTESPVLVTNLQPTPNFVIPSNLQAGRVTPLVAVAPEIHTMASDATLARSPERSAYAPVVVDEVVHTSNQPEVRQTLSDLPAYTSGAPTNIPTGPPIVVEPPRWGN